MSYETLEKVRNGTYTEKDVWYDTLTNLAASLYAYKIMLRNAGREPEAMMLEGFRQDLFTVRSAFSGATPPKPSETLRRVCYQLDTHFQLLRALRPDESPILQSVANVALWLAESDVHLFLNKEN